MDRFWSITTPLKYLRHRTKKRALLMITVAWSLSLLWIVPVTSWHRMFHGGIRQHPPHICETEFAHNVAFKVTAAVANFYLPTLSMLYIYGRIFFTICNRSRHHLGEVSSIRPSTTSWPKPRTSIEGRVPRNDSMTNAVTATGAATAASPSSVNAVNCEMVTLNRQKNNDDSSDTMSVNIDEVNEVGNRRQNSWKPPWTRMWTSMYHKGCRRRRWCRPSGNTMLTIPSNDRLYTDSNNRNEPVFDLYESLTLLDMHNAKTSIKSCGSSVTHYINVRVNVEYVAEDAQVDHNGPAIEMDQSTDGLTRTNISNAGETNRPNRTKSKPVSNLISQKERKAARQLGVIMCAFIICWLPYFIVFLVVAICPMCISGTLYTVTLWLGYINSTLNPFLYPLCNANFRRAFAKMLAKTCRFPWAKHQTYPFASQDVQNATKSRY